MNIATRLFYRLKFLWEDAADWNRSASKNRPLAAMKTPGSLRPPMPFIAEIVSIEKQETTASALSEGTSPRDQGTKVYVLSLKTSDVGLPVQAVLHPSMENGSNMKFDTLAPGDIIETVSYGTLPCSGVAGIMLGPVKKLPPAATAGYQWPADPRPAP